MPVAEELLILFKGDDSGLRSVLADAQGGISDLAEAAEGGLSKGMLVAGGAAIALGGAAVAAAATFDDAFVGVQQNVDATNTQMANLRQGLIDMSGQLPASAADLAKVASEAGELGVRADDILKFTKTVEDFAAATGVGSKEAEDRLGSLMKTLSLTPDQVAKLSDSIVGTANVLHTSDGAILSLSERLASAGHAAGLTQDQIVGLAGSLAAAGVDADSGGMAVSTAFTLMQKAVVEGGDKLNSFAKTAGMTADEFKQKFQTDAAGAMEAFLGGLKRVPTEAGGALGALDAVGLAGQRTQQSLLKAGEASSTYATGQAAAAAASEHGGAAATQAALRYDSAGSHFQTMLNKVVAMGIKLGDALMPFLLAIGHLIDVALPAVLVALTPLEVVFDGLGAVVGFLADNMDSLTAGIIAGAIAWGIMNGEAIFSAITAIPGVLAGIGEWIVEQWLLNFAMDANPIGAIVLGIALLVAGIVWLVTHVQGLREAFVAMWEGIKAAWDGVVEFFQAVWDGVVAVFQGQIDFLVEIWNGVLAVLDTVGKAFTGLWYGIRDNVITPLTKAWQGFWDFMNGMWAGIQTAFKTAAAGINAIWDTIVAAAKFAVNLLVDGLNIVIKGLNLLIDGINAIISNASKLLSFGLITISIPHIPEVPHLMVGGDIVKAGLAMLHAGERVVPAAQVDHGPGGGSGHAIQVGQLVFAPVVNTPMDMEQAFRDFQDRLLSLRRSEGVGF